MTTDFIEMPNGNVCQASVIRGVRAIEASDCYVTGRHPDRLVIDVAGGRECFMFEDFESCCAARDKIKQLIADCNDVNYFSWGATDAT